MDVHWSVRRSASDTDSTFWLTNGTFSQSFVPNCMPGKQIGALFNSPSFCKVVVVV